MAGNLKLSNRLRVVVAELGEYALLKRFLRHIVAASIAFCGVAIAAMALESLADWIDTHGYSRIISIGCHGTAYFIFFLDIAFLLFFLCVEALKLGRQIWRSFKEQ